ncbi:hypothetical protein EI94DRAFT_626048 [Lactarius quietus]|nr:hypothetical protein EI94DRAFT_626048 [Lactarius quietus]
MIHVVRRGYKYIFKEKVPFESQVFTHGLIATASRSKVMFGTRATLAYVFFGVRCLVTLALVIGYRYLMGPCICSITALSRITDSPAMAHFDTFRDQIAIAHPAFGHALWEPDPGEFPAVEVGDVGFVRDGKFHRLFNALLPADHPSNESRGVPEHHEPLKLR